MGFPVDYTDVFVPKIFIHALFFLGFLRSTLHSLFDFLGLSNLQPPSDLYFQQETPTRLPVNPPIFVILIREFLPADTFSIASAAAGCKDDDDDDESSPPEMCAVCLYDFEGGEEIRWLKNCKHMFHRSCIDRWMDHNHRTCPLCRTSLVPRHNEDEFNQRLWASSGVDIGVDHDYHDDYTNY